MFWLLSIGIECFSSVIFIIPAVIILQYALFKQLNFKKNILAFLFALYVIAVFSITGIPTAGTLKINFTFNLIPFIDIFNSPFAYIINTILNIILFIPMGFLLPFIWKEYRSIKKTVFMGLAVSICIELSQMFTFRVTDIDDLITNTLGTFSGYYFWKKIPLKLLKNTKPDAGMASGKKEPVIILAVVYIIAFLLKPFVSGRIWDIVLSSPLWESIK